MTAEITQDDRHALQPLSRLALEAFDLDSNCDRKTVRHERIRSNSARTSLFASTYISNLPTYKVRNLMISLSSENCSRGSAT